MNMVRASSNIAKVGGSSFRYSVIFTMYSVVLAVDSLSQQVCMSALISGLLFIFSVVVHSFERSASDS